MAIIRIPTDQPTFEAAMGVAQPGDTIQIEPGSSVANPVVTVNDLTIDNDRVDYGIGVTLGSGVIAVSLEGTSGGFVFDNAEDNVITAAGDGGGAPQKAVSVAVSGGNDQVDLSGRTGASNGLSVRYGSLTTDIVTGDIVAGPSGQSGTVTDGGGNSVSFSGIDSIFIQTGSGKDTIVTGDGDDYVETGNGNDTIDVGEGRDYVFAGAGADTITTVGEIRGLNGGSGQNDHWIGDLSWISGPVNLSFGIQERQTLSNGAKIIGMERITLTLGGNAGVTNQIRTEFSFQDDTVNGGAANDIFTPRLGHDVFNGGGGVNTLFVDYGNATTAVTSTRDPETGSVTVIKDANTSITFTSVQRMTVSTGSGSDVVGTGGAAATLNAGSGVDLWIADFSANASAIKLNLNLSSSVQNLGNGSSIVNVERVDLTTGGASEITTKTGNPNDGLNDTIRGGAASDVVTVGGGLDVFDGNGGVDTLIVDYATETGAIATSGDLATGGGSIGDGSNTSVSFTGVENFRITTGSAVDVITTGNGDDVVQARGGMDVLDGGGGSDAASYADKTAQVVVTLDGSNEISVFVGGVAEDTIRNFEGVISGSGDDILTGDANNNLFDGGLGADLMTGGLGDDVYYVNSTSDVVRELKGEGVDTVYSSVIFRFAGPTLYVENLTLTGSASTKGVGNTSANVITGSVGDNTLDGRAGRDVLTGGGGFDRFLFSTALDGTKNVDRIVDFGYGRIQLDDAIFTALGTGRLLEGAFMANTTGLATQADDRIVYNTATGDLFYDADGLNGAAGVKFAILENHYALRATDFAII